MRTKKDRFKVWKGYVFDRRIFQITLILIVIFLSAIVLFNGFEPRYFYECDSSLPCDLSEFKAVACKDFNLVESFKYSGFEDWLSASGLCNLETVPAGFSYGEEPSKLQQSAYLLVVLLLVIAFSVNHIIYNKKYELGGKI